MKPSQMPKSTPGASSAAPTPSSAAQAAPAICTAGTAGRRVIPAKERLWRRGDTFGLVWEGGREGRAGGGNEAYQEGEVCRRWFFPCAVATDMPQKGAGYTKNFQCGIAVSTLQILASQGQCQLEVPTSDHSRATDSFFRTHGHAGVPGGGKLSCPAWYFPRREGAETGVVGMVV